MRARNVALVIGDHPDRPFQTYELTADWTFLRFHHGHRGRNGNYSKAELETWKRRIESWTTSVDVFAYFNNDWNAYAVKNALLFKLQLRQSLLERQHGSNRSPFLSTRFSTASWSKTSRSAAFLFSADSASSHSTGVETVGRSFARSE